MIDLTLASAILRLTNLLHEQNAQFKNKTILRREEEVAIEEA